MYVHINIVILTVFMTVNDTLMGHLSIERVSEQIMLIVRLIEIAGVESAVMGLLSFNAKIFTA